MKLTREELAKIRHAHVSTILSPSPEQVAALFYFAETMLPVRDALRELLAAEERWTSRSEDWKGYVRAKCAFWKLARELAETDTEKGTADV